jgi:hypothetical protein
MLPDRQVISVTVDELEGQHSLTMIPKFAMLLISSSEIVIPKLRSEGAQERDLT